MLVIIVMYMRRVKSIVTNWTSRQYINHNSLIKCNIPWKRNISRFELLFYKTVLKISLLKCVIQTTMQGIDCAFSFHLEIMCANIHSLMHAKTLHTAYCHYGTDNVSPTLSHTRFIIRYLSPRNSTRKFAFTFGSRGGGGGGGSQSAISQYHTWLRNRLRSCITAKLIK